MGNKYGVPGLPKTSTESSVFPSDPEPVWQPLNELAPLGRVNEVDGKGRENLIFLRNVRPKITSLLQKADVFCLAAKALKC